MISIPIREEFRLEENILWGVTWVSGYNTYYLNLNNKQEKPHAGSGSKSPRNHCGDHLLN